jgi:hypothetical protein
MQIETTGGGYLDTGDRRIERKVVVATSGNISVPPSDSGWPLTNVNVTREPAGVLRGVFEFSQGGEGGASYDQYGKRVELTGGTREVLIYNHPSFAELSPDQVLEVQKAVDNKENKNFDNEIQAKLFSFLSRGTEYFLAPAVVGRVSEIESALPNLSPIAKVANPSELSAPENTFWICTAITANPIGTRFEVTREYTLNFNGWEEVSFLYSW